MKDQLEAMIAQMYGSGILYSEAVREFKKRFVMEALRQNKGNCCRAARELGVHRNTLSRTLTELKIDLREFRGKQNLHRGGAEARRKPAYGIVIGQNSGVIAG